MWGRWWPGLLQTRVGSCAHLGASCHGYSVIHTCPSLQPHLDCQEPVPKDLSQVFPPRATLTFPKAGDEPHPLYWLHSPSEKFHLQAGKKPRPQSL